MARGLGSVVDAFDDPETTEHLTLVISEVFEVDDPVEIAQILSLLRIVYVEGLTNSARYVAGGTQEQMSEGIRQTFSRIYWVSRGPIGVA